MANNITLPGVDQVLKTTDAGGVHTQHVIGSAQILSTDNTQTVTSAEAQPASPWQGAWELTRSLGVARILVTLAATDATEDGLGGTFIFEFSEDGISNNGISESRVITDFQTVRDFDLLNAGAYFRCSYEPDRALSSDSVFVTTTLRMSNDGAFVRLANQQIEEANAAMGQSFAYMKAFVKQTGRSINIRANAGEALLTASFDTEVALGNITGYELNAKFGRVKNIDAADNAVDIWAFADDTASPRADTKTFPSAASTIYVTSSSASDTAVTVTVQYISSTGAAVTVTGVALNGQTPVSIGATGLDVNRMYVDGATAAVGIIYATVGNDFTAGVPNDVTDVLAVAPVGFQQSQLAHFTVPLAKTLVINDVLMTVSRASGSAGSADVTLRVKNFGGVSRIRREWFPTTSVPINSQVGGIVIPARSQIVWRVDDVSDADTNVSVIWGYQLVDD